MQIQCQIQRFYPQASETQGDVDQAAMPPATNPNHCVPQAHFLEHCWAPDIERWESDTDSEGSDQEVDFHEGSNLSQTQVLALCM